MIVYSVSVELSHFKKFAYGPLLLTQYVLKLVGALASRINCCVFNSALKVVHV